MISAVSLHLQIYSRFLYCLYYFVVVVDAPACKDVMLGTAKIPLVDLIHKRTGMFNL